MLFSFQALSFSQVPLPGLTITPEDNQDGTKEAEFDLNPVIFEEDGQLVVLLAYNRDLFTATTIDRMLGHWIHLLLHGAREPHTPLSQLQLLSPGERHQLLVEWNALGPETPAHHACRRMLGTPPEDSAGTLVQIVDPNQQPVPIGVLGQLRLDEGTLGPQAQWTPQGLPQEPSSTVKPGSVTSDVPAETGREKAQVLRAEVGRRRSKLSAKKKALLAARLRRKKPAQAPQRDIPQRPEGAQIPLSFSQERLWFLQQLEPTSHAYHMLDLVRLEGTLDTQALERAFDEIVRRHEILRTAFPEVEGVPVQVVEPPPTDLLEHQDLTAHPASERMAKVLELAEEVTCQPFDLTTAGLIRARLFRLDAEDHVLAIINHHLISDDWSTGLFLRELTALYQAFQESKPSPLPDPEVQYGDFAVWQRGDAAAKILDKQLEYWIHQVEGVPHFLALPTDRPPPPRAHRCGPTPHAKDSRRGPYRAWRPPPETVRPPSSWPCSPSTRPSSSASLDSRSCWWGPPSRTAIGWRWKAFSASSSTPWCCAGT